MTSEKKNIRDWLWQKRFQLYLLYVTAVAAAAIAYWTMVPPTYEVSSIISVKPGRHGSDAPSPQTEHVRSHVFLLESEDVVRHAIDVVDVTRLYPDYRTDGVLTAADRAYIETKRNLAVKHEPLTDIIRVSFRHTKPTVAVEFVTAVVERFMRRYSELYTNEKAVAFYLDQQKKSHEEYIRSSAGLSAFSSANQVYRIREQQKLVLTQRSQLEVALLTTRGMIAEKAAQAEEIPALLAQMKPVGRLPQVTGLIQRSESKPDGQSKEIERLASDPPLLLVRVYQDTIALLVKLHTDLAGLRALQAKQIEEFGKLADFLGSLSRKEAEFEQLRLAVDHARQRYELFTKKAHESQLEHEQAAARLSNVQIVQSATPPPKPISPSLWILCTLVVALSLLPAGAAAAYHIAGSATPVSVHQGDQLPSSRSNREESDIDGKYRAPVESEQVRTGVGEYGRAPLRQVIAVEEQRVRT